MKLANLARSEATLNSGAFQSKVDELMKAFEERIETGIQKGVFVSESFTFQNDRYEVKVVDYVLKKLSDHGYKFQMSEHNAKQTKTYTVSW